MRANRTSTAAASSSAAAPMTSSSAAAADRPQQGDDDALRGESEGESDHDGSDGGVGYGPSHQADWRGHDSDGSQLMDYDDVDTATVAPSVYHTTPTALK